MPLDPTTGLARGRLRRAPRYVPPRDFTTLTPRTPVAPAPRFVPPRDYAGIPNVPSTTALAPFYPGQGASQGSPSIQDILGGDPGFQAYLASLGAQNIEDVSGRNAAIRRAAIQFGEVPDIAGLSGASGIPAGDLSSILGSDVSALAQENTKAGLSTVARIQQAHDDAVRFVEGSLAQRGMTRSGELGFGLGREQTAFTRQRYDSAQQLTDYFAGLQSALVASQRQREQDRYAAQNQALSNWFDLNPDYGYEPPATQQQQYQPPPTGPSTSPLTSSYNAQLLARLRRTNPRYYQTKYRSL